MLMNMNNASGSNQRAQSPTTYKLRVGGKDRQWTYQQAFAYAHDLFRHEKYATAELIFKKLCEASDRGPRAHLMLAVCKAQLADYQACRQVLDEVFEGERSVLASALQDIIVGACLGFKRDAARDLAELVNERKDLPTLCLLLGDLLETQRQFDKARKCWKLAVKRDRPGGAVALAAQAQLRRMAERN